MKWIIRNKMVRFESKEKKKDVSEQKRKKERKEENIGKEEKNKSN